MGVMNWPVETTLYDQYRQKPSGLMQMKIQKAVTIYKYINNVNYAWITN